MLSLIKPNEELAKRKEKAREFDAILRAWLSENTIELHKMDIARRKIESLIEKPIPDNATNDQLISYINKVKKELTTIIRKIE